MKKLPSRKLRPAITGFAALASCALATAPASAAITVAGELIADLRPGDLSASSAIWGNQSVSGDSVGDFSKNSAGNLNVVTVDSRTALYINDSVDNSVTSASTIPISLGGNSSRSAEAWLYADALDGSQGVVSWGTTGNDEFSRFTYAGGGNGLLSAWFNDVGWDGATLPTGEWVHVAWTYDGSDDTVKGYINGDLVQTTTMPNTLATGTSPIHVGQSRPGADPFNGYISEVRVHSGLLSDGDVMNNYIEGIPEPSTLALVGLGGLLGFRRRRR